MCIFYKYPPHCAGLQKPIDVLLALKRLTGYPFVLKHRLINMIKLSFCDHHSTNQFFSWRISCGFPFSLSPFLFLQNLDFVIFLFSPLFFPALQSFLWFPFKLQSPSFLNPLSGLNLNHWNYIRCRNTLLFSKRWVSLDSQSIPLDGYLFSSTTF